MIFIAMHHFAFAIPAVAAMSTPWGERPSQCVVEVPHSSTLVHLQDSVGLRDAEGNVEIVNVPDACRDDDVMRKMHSRHQGQQDNFSTNGWLDNKGYTDNSGFSKFTGSFNVPSNPPNPQQPETLYYFFGMENLIGGPVNILQPVLTWGDETEGAVGGWSIWSWACCPSYITFNSKNVGGLQEGMLVDGVIQRDNSDTWTVDTSFVDLAGQRHNSTLVAEVGAYTYNWADVTLEVYNVTSCDQHSPGKVTFQNLELYGSNGEQLAPQWSGADSSECGGVVTVEDQGTISIQHNTNVVV